MYIFFEKIQRKVQSQLNEIADVFLKSIAVKKYPHPAFYKKSVADRISRSNESARETAEQQQSSALVVQERQQQPRVQRRQQPQQPQLSRQRDTNRASDVVSCDFDNSIKDMRSTINERVIDTLNGVSLNDEKQTIETLSDILNQCLRYELAVVNLVTLNRLIVKALENFSNMHVEYDARIKQLQENFKRDSGDKSKLEVKSSKRGDKIKPKELRKLQDGLDTTRDVLQKLLNQVPMQLGVLKTELELIALYDNTDDSEKVHRFLTDPLIVEIVKRSCRLNRAYAVLRHSWTSLIPDDFF
ncbi:hypothetical protein KPH14_013063 [Odynerus spinipes]|uniref:Uncharacterized protein n=1 Tax=Odynerus spinipes TaxID=1348599 RepID=A0AAD9VHK9_9HYME|nr:hypothetical protein KPH14_013063 [Odynerus spinipes]